MYTNAHNALIIVLFVIVALCIVWVKKHKDRAAAIEAKAKAEVDHLKQQIISLTAKTPKS